jgi:hypothetical protein
VRSLKSYREAASSRLAVDPKRWLREDWLRLACTPCLLPRLYCVAVTYNTSKSACLSRGEGGFSCSAGCHGCSMLQGVQEIQNWDGMDWIGLDGVNDPIPVAKQGGLSAVISHKPGLGGQSGDICCE